MITAKNTRDLLDDKANTIQAINKRIKQEKKAPPYQRRYIPIKISGKYRPRGYTIKYIDKNDLKEYIER